tara:strand:- start:6749 stop:7039 length:291 start_codon:yes stop_codon:yes gene_type:complete
MIKSLTILKTKLMKTEEKQQQGKIDFEPFYQALEDDPKLLEEALEILLEMVNSEPKSIKKLALLIKVDSRFLFNEIVELYKLNQDKGNTLSCCGGI